jgi:hypothetical protein
VPTPSAPDRRAHAWVLALPEGRDATDLVLRALARAGVEADRRSAGDGVVALRTRPAPWPRVVFAARSLAARGLVTPLLRVEEG